ncbi:SufS family cysteine desulfurase [Plantibacter sp. VKM Ac-2880]|uniref:SufS family cysteine desulfurase n=1 Tax=Plantibacter sp. VKM Ac-2880 TaxID=2783827 RepID=UPI00188ED913|nr:SufS family cysteine desulfurase [Plantibacter sp. VKM Ac-2880]MBF4569555.1 SufS family cysteine desulfurase [Plantibacter sp. VKM Ac-2880]
MTSSLSTTPAAALDQAEIAALRERFPILAREMNGHPLVYLDSGATSQRPTEVLDAERHFATHANAAVHRGAHLLAAEATESFEDARATVAAFIGADERELVWTSGATAALNIIAGAIGNASAGLGGAAAERFGLGPGDEIVVTELEHHANLIPWQQLAARTGATLRHLPVDENGVLSLDAATAVIGDRARILAFAHVSNVTGAIAPVTELVALAQRVGALTVLDACQSVPHLPVDVTELGVDFLVFSGHKMLGPNGIGALWGRRALLDALPPFLTGGSMITIVTLDGAEFLPAPQRFEAGTQPVSQAIALASAVRFLQDVGMDRIHATEAAYGRRLAAGLAAVPGIRLIGPQPGSPRAGLASFDVAGVHAHDVGQFFDDRGIAVRVGHHCAQPLHRRLGLTASTRASSYLYTLESEIEAFLDAAALVGPFFGVGR